MKNKLSSRHKIILAAAVVSLLLGFFNYLFFQSHIALFRLIPFRPENTFTIHNNLVRIFVKGYLSDIAWCSSLYLVTVLLSERNSLDLVGKILILLLPFMTEVAQYFGLIRGIFDWYDLLTYFIILVIFIIFFPTLMKKQNEKG